MSSLSGHQVDEVLFWIFTSSLILSKKSSIDDLNPYLGWSQDLWLQSQDVRNPTLTSDTRSH